MGGRVLLCRYAQVAERAALALAFSCSFRSARLMKGLAELLGVWLKRHQQLLISHFGLLPDRACRFRGAFAYSLWFCLFALIGYRAVVGKHSSLGHLITVSMGTIGVSCY